MLQVLQLMFPSQDCNEKVLFRLFFQMRELPLSHLKRKSQQSSLRELSSGSVLSSSVFCDTFCLISLLSLQPLNDDFLPSHTIHINIDFV